MNQSSRRFTLQPQGPFDLARESRHFGGWPALPDDPSTLVLAFPIEHSGESAAVVLRQADDGAIVGAVHGGPDALAEVAWRQALAALSLDVDGRAWPEVGERDPEIGQLQHAYGFLRPVLFHSPYEAAASFVLGHRISIAQVRRLRARLAEALGTAISIDGAVFHAFPTPAQVLQADELPGVPEVKAGRLRAIARAARGRMADPRAAARAAGRGGAGAAAVAAGSRPVLRVGHPVPRRRDRRRRRRRRHHAVRRHAALRARHAREPHRRARAGRGLGAVPHVGGRAAARLGAERGGDATAAGRATQPGGGVRERRPGRYLLLMPR